MSSQQDPWTRAQFLRRLAAVAKTRRTAKILYAQARYYEAKYLKEGRETTHSPELRRDGEQITTPLPRWFREAKGAARCSNCGDNRGVWWYRKVTGSESTTKKNYIRVRILARIRRGAFDSAKELMKCSVPLCRDCANGDTK